MKRYYLTSFISNFYRIGVCLLPAFTISAQLPAGIEAEFLMIKGLIKPLKALPDSIKTYQLHVETIPMSGLDKQFIKRVVTFDNYTETSAPADLKLYVTMSIPQNRHELHQIMYNNYQIKAELTPQLKLEVKTNQDSILFSKSNEQVWTYRTNITPSEKEAYNAYNSWLYTPDYWKFVSNAYHEALIQVTAHLRSSYDYQTESLQFIYPQTALSASEEKSLFAKNTWFTSDILKGLNCGYSQQETYQRLKPYLAFFEQQLPIAKENKLLYYCTLYNLVNAYGSIELYDTAMYYANSLITASLDYDSTTDLVTCISQRKEQKFRFDKYKETKTEHFGFVSRWNPQQLDSLKKQTNLKADLILVNDSIKNVTLYDFINYFRERGEIKWQKDKSDITLNDKSSYIITTANNIIEIRTSNSIFVVIRKNKTDITSTISGQKVPIGDQYYLAEQLFKTPKIGLYQTLPNMTVKNIQLYKPKKDSKIYANFLKYLKNTINFGHSIPANSTVNNVLLPIEMVNDLANPIPVNEVNYDSTQFVKIGNSKDFISIDNQNSLAEGLKNCSVVFKLAKHGYYSKYQLLDAVQAYDRLCNDVPYSTAENKSNNEQKTPTESTTHVPKQVLVRWELGTGYNAFSSILGVNTQIRLMDKLSLRAGVGLGVWGVKSAIGFKYDLLSDLNVYYRRGWSLSLGYTHSTGTQVTSFGEKDIAINQSAISTLYFSTIFSQMGARKKGWFYEVGYGLALQKQAWSLVDPNMAGSDKSLSLDVAFVKPGGLILGVGYAWGLF